MRKLTLTSLVLALITLVACGGGELGSQNRNPDPDSPILQLGSKGGFTTPEINLGRGPTYTLLTGGRLIFEGPVIAIYPGPLLPNYQVVQLSDNQVDEILALVEEIGLPDMESELDDSAASTVADATTEVLTYWDENGAHQYSVYGLGIDPNPSSPATTAMVELVDTLSTSAFSGEPEIYEGDRVRIIAGVAQSAPDPEFEDVRPWPIEGEDPNQWTELNLGFMCKVFGPEILDRFADATQTTRWLHPDPMMDAPPFELLVRPLHPGEPDCPEAD
ncbi:MAG: hypothetical protein ACRDWS_03435 [Acidimicrobiia bacterium]